MCLIGGAGTHEQLSSTLLADAAPVWLTTTGQQLDITVRFDVTGNCSFGLYVLASKTLSEYRSTLTSMHVNS